MNDTTTLFPGITLRCCRDGRFKHGCLTVQLVRPMAQDEAALNALLPAVLLRGTRRCADIRAITQELENEGVVEAFLKDNSEFCLEPLSLPAPFPRNESGMLALVPVSYTHQTLPTL